jgi:predicted Zn-dependent protease
MSAESLRAGVMAPAPDFLSEADCAVLMRQVMGFARGGGNTVVNLDSTWMGNVRWARNRISGGEDTRTNQIQIERAIRGAAGSVALNEIDDAALEQAVRRAEHQSSLEYTHPESDLADDYQEPYSHPKIWFDTTYHLDAGQRADVARRAIEPIEQAGMVAAGYLEVKAIGRSVQSSRSARKPLYYPWTTAQFSITVRDPEGSGSGWAGVDWNDWARIDPMQLTQTALDKCLRSRNPVRVEPGRYTAILEPQAVCDLMTPVIDPQIDLFMAEMGVSVFSGRKIPLTRIGERVFDRRITITADPLDPDLGAPPFDRDGHVYNPVTWIEQGVLQHLAYARPRGVTDFHLNHGIPTNRAYRMSGGPTSLAEMIQTTARGLYVTRFSTLEVLNGRTLLSCGYTRDGLWLVENGKITKPVKNFRFTESPMFVFNQVEQLGPPQRVFRPKAPTVVPPVKVRDFSFTSLTDAV